MEEELIPYFISVGDKVGVKLTRKINGKPSGEKKILKGTVVKILPKGFDVKLDCDGKIINRKILDLVI